jgi:hypothetical protein
MLLYSREVRAFPIVLLLLALAGCSEPPQKEIDEAKSAIDAARAAGADQYAAEEFTGAAATLEKARASVGERDYRQALSYAIDARQRAVEASRLVPAARERVKADAEAELKRTAASVTHLEAVVRAAQAAKVPARELRTARETHDAARGVLQEARTALDARKYAEAGALLRGVRGNVDSAAAAVSSIPQRPRSKKGRR